MPRFRILAVPLVSMASAMLPAGFAHAQQVSGSVTAPPARSVSYFATRKSSGESPPLPRADNGGCRGLDGLRGQAREAQIGGSVYVGCSIVTEGGQDEAREGRGAVAVRGLFWGALIGGLIGWTQRHPDSFFGGLESVVAGAIVGAPIGMVVFLLITPL